MDEAQLVARLPGMHTPRVPSPALHALSTVVHMYKPRTREEWGEENQKLLQLVLCGSDYESSLGLHQTLFKQTREVLGER